MSTFEQGSLDKDVIAELATVTVLSSQFYFFVVGCAIKDWVTLWLAQHTSLNCYTENIAFLIFRDFNFLAMLLLLLCCSVKAFIKVKSWHCAQLRVG